MKKSRRLYRAQKMQIYTPKSLDTISTAKTPLIEGHEDPDNIPAAKTSITESPDGFDSIPTAKIPLIESSEDLDTISTTKIPAVENCEDLDSATTVKTPIIMDSASLESISTIKNPAIIPSDISQLKTEKVSIIPPSQVVPPLHPSMDKPTGPFPALPSSQTGLQRWRSLALIALLCIVLTRAISMGATQFAGPQGWAYALSGPVSQTNANLLKDINSQIHHTAGHANAAHSTPLTAQQYINLIVHKMTLDQKLGQMMIVQFLGSTYSLPLSTMISQYNVGAVLLFSINGNIVAQQQLKSLVQQMQAASSPIPPGIATDQEGGYVNRLLNLVGQRPAAATIGATNDASKARAEGVQDAKDLASYGININLAPVVDVDGTSASELHSDLRTYGSDPNTVTSMADAYLQGLQQSGQVTGTLKHFPGLGDVIIDPHKGLPSLLRSRSELEGIEWAPYRALIQRGDAHAIMVTHEIVEAVDTTRPASLSPGVIQGILRNELGFQGVIMTDSLEMAGILDSYTPGQAAALSIEAGSDMIMGAGSPQDITAMFAGIKQGMLAGAISEQRIDESVDRILLMKYKMGLLPLPQK